MDLLGRRLWEMFVEMAKVVRNAKGIRMYKISTPSWDFGEFRVVIVLSVGVLLKDQFLPNKHDYMTWLSPSFGNLICG